MIPLTNLFNSNTQSAGSWTLVHLTQSVGSWTLVHLTQSVGSWTLVHLTQSVGSWTLVHLTQSVGSWTLPSHLHSLHIPTNSSCMKGCPTQRVSAIRVHPCSEQPCNFIQIATLDTFQEPSCRLCKDETRQQQYTMRATD